LHSIVFQSVHQPISAITLLFNALLVPIPVCNVQDQLIPHVPAVSMDTIFCLTLAIYLALLHIFKIYQFVPPAYLPAKHVLHLQYVFLVRMELTFTVQTAKHHVEMVLP